MTANQTEFPMSVAVCAWCKPRDQRENPGLRSHGICPRHLRKMILEAQGIIRSRTRSAPFPKDVRESMLLPL